MSKDINDKPQLASKKGGESEASANRTIFISGEVNENMVRGIISGLFRYELDSPTLDILMYIDTYGGHADSFLAIYDIIKTLCRCDVATVCVGKAMSCGQLILMSGAKGKRFALENSRILLHPMSGGMYGNIHSIDNEAAEARRMQEQLEEITLKNSKLDRATLKKLMSKDSYLTPIQAKKYGLIDHIVKKPSDLYAKIKIAN
jgi:ATP-dependent Clp protease protease subunit